MSLFCDCETLNVAKVRFQPNVYPDRDMKQLPRPPIRIKSTRVAPSLKCKCDHIRGCNITPDWAPDCPQYLLILSLAWGNHRNNIKLHM